MTSPPSRALPSDRTAPDRTPPDRSGAVHLVLQLAGLAAALAGVYLLAGLAVALIVGGALVAVGSLVLEWLATRPARSEVE